MRHQNHLFSDVQDQTPHIEIRHSQIKNHPTVESHGDTTKTLTGRNCGENCCSR